MEETARSFSIKNKSKFALRGSESHKIYNKYLKMPMILSRNHMLYRKKRFVMYPRPAISRSAEVSSSDRSASHHSEGSSQVSASAGPSRSSSPHSISNPYSCVSSRNAEMFGSAGTQREMLERQEQCAAEVCIKQRQVTNDDDWGYFVDIEKPFYDGSKSNPRATKGFITNTKNSPFV